MSKWEAAYNASGLAASNTQLYIGIAILVYMYFTVFLLQNYLLVKKGGTDSQNDEKETKVRWKYVKMKEEEIRQNHIEEFIFAMHEDIKQGRWVSHLLCFCIDLISPSLCVCVSLGNKSSINIGEY